MVDVVTAGNNASTVSVLLGTGGGTFGASTGYTFSASLKDMRLRDFNGDGIQDIGAVSNSGFHLMAGTGTGLFGAERTTSVSVTATRMDAADVNNDGIYDIVATDNTNGGVVYHGTADGTFVHAASLDPSVGAIGITDAKFADLDGDGILDVLLAAADNLTIFKGKSDGSYEEYANESGSLGTGFVSIADLNRDGVLDFVAPYNIAGRVRIILAETGESATIQQFNLSTRETALQALSALDAIASRISGELGEIGGTQSRINTALSTLRSMADNSEAARARIEDVDVATEAAQSVRSQILQQSASTVLANANLNQKLILELLRF